MSLRRLPVMELDWRPPATTVIDAAQLDAQFRLVSAVRNAEREAGAVLKAASRKAEQIVRHAYQTQRQIQTAAQEEWARNQQAMLRRCEARWLETHVASLRDDADLERHIIQAVHARVHHCIEQVLTAWCLQQSPDEALCARLTTQVVHMASQGALRLQVHPEMVALACERFGERLTVSAAPSLARDQAVLISSQLSLSFSLSRHLQQLFDWLSLSGDDGMAHDAETACACVTEDADGEE